MPYLVFCMSLCYDLSCCDLCTLYLSNFFQMVSKQYLVDFVHTDNLWVFLM